MEKLRFSVDTGGTFTDIVLLDENTGEFLIEKTSTTTENTLNGVLKAIEKANLDLSKAKSFFAHGSTTALNALIEKKGVSVAFITTEGFRDIPEIGRFNRVEMYNLKYRKPQQIVPRELRFEVKERLNAKGEIVAELNDAEVRKLVNHLRAKGVKAVAVCLLHAYKNAVHEKKIKEIIQQECPEIIVAISSDVVREHREYERSMTTILNAYLAPVVEAWISELENELEHRKFQGQLLITRSDGGGMTSSAAKSSPINMLLSGPAGGVIGGLFIAENFNHPNIITADVGGTSFDVCMIKDGKARVEQEKRASGYPILIPNLDIRAIGAGGGSIARIDDAGALHVGPQSAGAVPGPIAYKQGGTEPTVTDAVVCNGYIDPENFLGGEMRLDTESAGEGIRRQIADPLGMDLHRAADGILTLAISNMTEAIKDLAAEKGDDPREFSLLAYGGGGALFAARLMNEMKMKSTIIPIASANFSAWGMLMVDVRHDFVQTLMKRFDDVTPKKLNTMFDRLIRKGIAILSEEGILEEQRAIFRTMDIRYQGQEHSVNVPLGTDSVKEDDIDWIYRKFSSVYKEVYGLVLDQPAEIVNLRIEAVGRIPKPILKELDSGPRDAGAALKGQRNVFCMANKRWIEYAIYDRSRLMSQNIVQGPALIEEATTVTVVPPGHHCEVDRMGNLLILNDPEANK